MEYTFRPIIDDPDCFARTNAKLKPLREFFEPSKGTKIFFNVFLANANYCPNYYLENGLKFKHDNKDSISSRVLLNTISHQKYIQCC